MNRPALYNPCANGLAAKAWECLRRNHEFSAFLREAIKTQRGTAALPFPPQTNKLAFAALVEMSYHPRIMGKSGLCTWGRLNLEARDKIGWAVESIEGPMRIDWPPPTKSVLQYEDLDVYLQTHSGFLVSVPKYVRDGEHRKEILDRLAKIVPQPAKDTRSYKPRGSILGSEKEWSQFLITEYWEGIGFNREEASNLAAYEHYNTEDREVRMLRLGKSPKACEQTARDFLNKNHSIHNDRSTVIASCEAIQEAITSVFPTFRPIPS